MPCKVHCLPQHSENSHIILIVAFEEDHMLLTRAGAQSRLDVASAPIQSAFIGKPFDGFVQRPKIKVPLANAPIFLGISTNTFDIFGSSPLC
jgi:hypothetical protein